MNCNEEFIVKAIGKLTLDFNFSWEEQKRIREDLYYCLYGYEILNLNKSLVKSDFDEKLMLYFQIKKLEGYSDKTLKNYYYILKRFSAWINKPVSTITKNDIRMYLIQNTDNLKPSTVNTITFTIKSFFTWLINEELIASNPAKNITTTKLPKRLRKSLTIEELEKLRLACKDDRDRCIIEFIFATGCRVSEIVSINLENLNMNENTLKIVGKGDKERIVCFNDKTKLYINNYIKTRTDNNPALFISQRKPFKRLGTRGIEVIVSKISARAGLNKSVYPHLLRHTMATLGYQSGIDITTIQCLLGHTSPVTTQIYADQNIDNVKHEYKQHMIH